MRSFLGLGNASVCAEQEMSYLVQGLSPKLPVNGSYEKEREVLRDIYPR